MNDEEMKRLVVSESISKPSEHLEKGCFPLFLGLLGLLLFLVMLSGCQDEPKEKRYWSRDCGGFTAACLKKGPPPERPANLPPGAMWYE